MQPQGVAREFAGGQLHQPLLLDEARAEPDGGHRHTDRGDGHRRVRAEHQVRRRQQEQQRGGQPRAHGGGQQAADRHVPRRTCRAPPQANRVPAAWGAYDT
ncbi:hypothetical protein GCM10017687_48320 [Streptomyces echinatus]